MFELSVLKIKLSLSVQNFSYSYFATKLKYFISFFLTRSLGKNDNILKKTDRFILNKDENVLLFAVSLYGKLEKKGISPKEDPWDNVFNVTPFCFLALDSKIKSTTPSMII